MAKNRLPDVARLSATGMIIAMEWIENKHGGHVRMRIAVRNSNPKKKNTYYSLCINDIGDPELAKYVFDMFKEKDIITITDFKADSYQVAGKTYTAYWGSQVEAPETLSYYDEDPINPDDIPFN